MAGDDDEEDIDDIEHEFNIDDEHNKNKLIVEAMLHGKMSYGRGHEDEENSQFPPVIAGVRSRPVSKNNYISSTTVIHSSNELYTIRFEEEPFLKTQTKRLH